MLTEMVATKILARASLSTSESRLEAKAVGAARLVLTKETRARLDAAPPSADVETTGAR
jgi:hypothetical protein